MHLAIERILTRIDVGFTEYSVVRGDSWSSLVDGNAQVVSLCVYEKYTDTKKYQAYAWQQHSMHVLLLGRSCCSSPSTKEHHGIIMTLNPSNTGTFLNCKI